MKFIKITGIVIMLAASVTIGHNVNLYHGAGQLIGATWGTVGGCEIDYPMQAACWLGDRN